MRLRLGSILLLAALLVAVPVGTASAKKKGPPAKVIKRLLTAQYTQESKDYPTTVKESYKIKSTKHGKSHRGNHFADGTPANTKTTVFPVKVKAKYVKCITSGTDVDVYLEDITGSYGFFKDEFKAWTFRLYSEDRTDSSAAHQPAGTPCPIS